MNPAPLLACRDIAFERDDLPLFEGVSLSLQRGQVLQISGANGSGKTTLMRILATAITPSTGEVFWRGEAIDRRLAEYRGDLLYFGHLPGVKAGLSPRENLAWLGHLYPCGGTGPDKALHLVGLAGYEDTPCHALSAGQQRRVGLARLYVAGATLWLLDEPLTAIDRAGVLELEQLMQRHLDGGGAIVVTSHQPLGLTGVRELQLEHYGVGN